MAESELKQRAGEYFRRAYEHQQKGEYEDAIELYSHSIEAFATAEAYTFRGWAYSFQHNYTQAIADCKKALKIDPDFGNPYNDIGAYLIEQEQWDAAIPWFKKALAAPKYDSYFFPHFNLGTQRILGVLQRIAICYLIASAIYLYTSVRGQILWIANLFTAY